MEFDFNRGNGVVGLFLISVAISLVFFSIAYISVGAGWVGEYNEEGDSDALDIAWNWFRGAIIAIIVAIICFIVGGIQLKKNNTLAKTQKKEKKFWVFDLSEKGWVPIIGIGAGLVFLYNGILYRIEAASWEASLYYAPSIWKIEEALSWYNSSRIMFFIAIALFGISAVMLAMKWDRVKKSSKV